jgi:hypothetical protein
MVNATTSAEVKSLGIETETRVSWQDYPDPSMLYLNPFTAARNKAKKRQTEIAAELNIEHLEVIRLEQAIFTRIPSNVSEYYMYKLGMPEAWEAGYRMFQRMLRTSAPRPIHGVWQMPRGELTFRRWRLHNWPTISQMGWCKAFAIHPSALYAIEKGATAQVPGDILMALIEANVMSEEQARNFAYRMRQANAVRANPKAA